MPPNLTEIISTYLHKVKTANKEMTQKEAFKDLLNRLNAREKDIDQMILRSKPYPLRMGPSRNFLK